MKIAVTYENGQVFQHFGHTEQFKIYEAAEGKVVSARVVETGAAVPPEIRAWRPGGFPAGTWSGHPDLRRHRRRRPQRPG